MNKNEDIVIDNEWQDNLNEEMFKLNTDWASIIDMSQDAINDFKQKGTFTEMVEILTRLLEYNKNALIFEEKVRTINEINGDNVIWQ